MSEQILSAQDIAIVASTPKMPAGRYARDDTDRLWVYVQASEVLVQGDTLVKVAQAGNDNGLAAAALDTRRLTDTGNSPWTTTALIGASFLALDGHVYWVWIDDGTGPGQGGPILNRIDDDNIDFYNTVSDDGLLSAALDTTSDYTFWTNSRVAQSAGTAGTERVGGFVQHQAGITIDSWFWALVEGEGLASQDDSGSDIVLDAGIVSGDEPGTVQGLTPATEEEVASICGYGRVNTSGADATTPILAACTRIFGRMTDAPSNLNTAYPSRSIGKL